MQNNNDKNNFLVLIVDESFSFRKFLKEELNKIGITNIKQANTYKEAIQILNKYKSNDIFTIPILSFTDINLKKFDKKGDFSFLEYLQNIKNEFPLNKEIINVNVCTSSEFATKENILKVLKFDANNCLVKPITKETIENIINTFINKINLSIKNNNQPNHNIKDNSKCKEPFTITEVFEDNKTIKETVKLLSKEEIEKLLNINDEIHEFFNLNEPIIQINNKRYSKNELIGKTIQVNSNVADVKCIATISEIHIDLEDNENYFFIIDNIKNIEGNIELLFNNSNKEFYSVCLFEVEKVIEDENMNNEVVDIEKIVNESKKIFNESKNNHNILSDEEYFETIKNMDIDNIDIYGSYNQQKQITLYDFKRPNRISKDELRYIRKIHDKFTRKFEIKLAKLLNVELDKVEIQLHSTDQMTYGEALMSMPNPTSFNIFSINLSNDLMIVEINPSIFKTIINKLSNGKNNPIEEYNGFYNFDIFEKDKIIVEKLLNSIKEELKDAFLPFELNLEVKFMETNLNLEQITFQHEIVVINMFEIVYGMNSGFLSIVYTEEFLRKIFNVIDVKTNSLLKTNNSLDLNQSLISNLYKVDANVDFIIGITKMNLKTILSIRKKDVLYFEKIKDIYVNNKSILVNKIKGKIMKENKSKKKNNKKVKIDVLNDIELDVTLRVGSCQMTFEEISKLDINSIIELNKLNNEPLEILVENKVIAIGEIVVVDGNYGVQITKVFSNEK